MWSRSKVVEGETQRGFNLADGEVSRSMSLMIPINNNNTSKIMMLTFVVGNVPRCCWGADARRRSRCKTFAAVAGLLGAVR